MPWDTSSASIYFDPDSTVIDSAVSPLRAVRLASIALGRSIDQTPVSVTDVAQHVNRIFVVDSKGRRLRIYDSRGVLLAETGSWGQGDGQFRRPMRIALSHDTVVVLDVVLGGALDYFSVDGVFLGREALGLDGAVATSIAIGPRLRVIAATDPQTKAGSPMLVVVRDPAGRQVSANCMQDPEYLRSRARGGMTSAYTYTSVATAPKGAMRILCIQPISPTIQVADSAGNTIAVVHNAPPFYRAPRDIPMTLNEVDKHAFESSWTWHYRVFARGAGFLSVYQTVSAKTGQRDYWLYSCPDLAKRAHCVAGPVHGEPVRFAEPDTLVVVNESVGAENRMRLDTYILHW